MSELVAIRLAEPSATADAVHRVWDTGDAVVVLDPRASDGVVAALLERLHPHAVVLARPDAGVRVTRMPSGRSVPAGTAAVVLTSGSTGRPRAIALSSDAMDASADAAIRRLGCRPGDAWLGALPLHHVAGLGVLRRARRLRTPAEVHASFDVEAVAASSARWWPLVPTMLVRLLEAGVDLAGRKILLGGAPSDAELLERARAAGATVTVSYGMTETCGGCVYDGVPLDGVQVDISGTGHVRLRGAVLADGQREDDGTVTSVLDPDGWLTTADLGHLVDGRLQVDGRADHVILTGGTNVVPEQVEQALESHPDVVAAAVVGESDPTWGQRVVALVVPRDPANPPSLASLRDHVGEAIGRHAAPRELRHVATIPRTSLGKVARAELAAIARDPGPTDTV